MAGGSRHDGVRSLLVGYPGLLAVYQSLRARLRPDRRPALVFVLGCEGSGVNVLRRSLSLDPAVRGFDERQNDEYYVGWSLRPEHEIGELLADSPVTVLLKPVRTVVRRPVGHLLAEWAGYDLRTVWIYRDPVAVYRFRAEREAEPIEPGPFIEEWNRINSSALDALDGRMAVVSYDHLITDEKVLHTLNRWLGIRGEHLFRPGRSISPAALPPAVVATIREGTSGTLERLQAATEQFLDVNGSSGPVEQDER